MHLGVEYYRRAVALDPGNADAGYHLAVALRRLGRLAEAILHYRRLLEFDPNRQDLRTELEDVERQLADQAREPRR